MNVCKAGLFDMDGVIFDSERALRSCWRELAEQRGLSDMDRVYERCLGITKPRTIAILKEEYGEDFPFDWFYETAFSLYMERFSGGRLPIKPGAVELLRFLREKGLPIALASSTYAPTVESRLKDGGLRDCFDHVITGDMVSRSKPDPEIFLLACEKCGVKPREAWVIEDSFNGIRAAFAGGMHPIMVPDLAGPDEEIRRKAEVVLPSLYEVKDYLSRYIESAHTA